MVFCIDMRLARSGQISENQAQVFHVVSRVVDKRKVLGDVEKSVFLEMVRQFEAFSGVDVLTHCVMGNHFHLMVHVPVKPESISDEEVWERMTHIYSKARMEAIEDEIQQEISRGYKDCEKDMLDGMRDRMFSLSMFVKDVKQKFTGWFNRRHERKGTLWEERFKSILVEGNSNAMMMTAAYIELNPVRAGIVKHVKDYRWCSYTAAIAGVESARKGISKVVGGLDSNKSWEEIELDYRKFFNFKASGNNKKNADDQEKPMTAAEAMLARVRYFTEGYIIGSKAFIEQHFKAKRDTISPNRKKICNKMPGNYWEGLHSFRNLE